METKENNKYKPFNLEEAKAGKSVCTRGGHKAKIICFDARTFGDYPPEKRVVWEAVDKNGCGFAHSFSLRDTIRLIDEDIKIKIKLKED